MGINIGLVVFFGRDDSEERGRGPAVELVLVFHEDGADSVVSLGHFELCDSGERPATSVAIFQVDDNVADLEFWA